MPGPPDLPARYREGRLRSAGLFLLSLGFTGVSLLFAVNGGHVFWVGVTLFGAAIPVSAISLVRPQTLELTEAGIRATSPLKTIDIPWGLIARFLPVRIAGPYATTAGRMVGLELTPDALARRPDLVTRRAAKLSNAMAGCDTALPSTNAYGEDVDQLVATLEQLRLAYGVSHHAIADPGGSGPGGFDDEVAYAANQTGVAHRVAAEVAEAELEYLARCGIADYRPQRWRFYPPEVAVPLEHSADGTPIVDDDWLTRDLAHRLGLDEPTVVAVQSALARFAT